jgi:hypothetical protein
MPLSLDEIRACAADAIAARHFYIGDGLELEWEHAEAENVPWEIYKGRLLDASQTRERRTFEAWNVYSIDEFGRSTEPLLSLKLDVETGEIHVVRAILCYAWEAYDAGDNVILSRETKKWMRELVGTISVGRFGDAPASLARELSELLFRAVIGMSRLPLTSVETPLPAFSLGRLAYFRVATGVKTCGPLRTWQDLTDQVLLRGVPKLERAKLLETFVHAVPRDELGAAAKQWMTRFTEAEHTVFLQLHEGIHKRFEKSAYFLERADNSALIGREHLLYTIEVLFNEAALTPYTDLVDKALALSEVLEAQGLLTALDLAHLLGTLIRRLTRHLTAYDLVTFHHRGANYPDALLLDALMKAFLRLIERDEALLMPDTSDDVRQEERKWLGRRALRMGWLVRKSYEGHLVPDEPTSPGENMRILPAPHRRVPEEQIVNPANRTKRLYQGDPLEAHLGHSAKQVLRRSIEDLKRPSELRELGVAIFLDRPLGGGKSRTDPDQTPMLSYLAFSRSIARERLARILSDQKLTQIEANYPCFERAMDALQVRGVFVRDVTESARDAIVSIADAIRAAEDFLLLQNTMPTWFGFHWGYHLGPALEPFSLDYLCSNEAVLVLRTTRSKSQNETLAIYDPEQRKRVELSFDPGKGYVMHQGVEYPASPLRILRVWDEDKGTGELRERNLCGDPILLEPPTS